MYLCITIIYGDEHQVGNSNLFTIVVPGTLNHVRTAIGYMLKCIQKTGISTEDETFFEFRVVINELLQNAVRHGTKGNCEKHIKITAGLGENGNVTITVEDEGEGYCYDSLCCSKGILDEACNLEETGRGMIIVERLCEKVEVNKKGNRITVVKSCKSP
jgi:serine/threonine-protein kinase RsbW